MLSAMKRATLILASEASCARRECASEASRFFHSYFFRLENSDKEHLVKFWFESKIFSVWVHFYSRIIFLISSDKRYLKIFNKRGLYPKSINHLFFFFFFFFKREKFFRKNKGHEQGLKIKDDYSWRIFGLLEICIVTSCAHFHNALLTRMTNMPSNVRSKLVKYRSHIICAQKMLQSM